MTQPEPMVLPPSSPQELKQLPRWAAWLSYAVLLILGTLVAIAGAFVQALRWSVGPLSIPIGIVLVLGVSIFLARGGAWFTLRRGGAIAVSVGWYLGTVPFLSTGPGNDVVFLADMHDLLYILLGAIIMTVVAFWPLPRTVRAQLIRTKQQ